jgi:hypothetical protein
VDIKAITVNFGARYDQFAEFVSEWQLSPRVNVVWQPADATTLHAGYSRYKGCMTPPISPWPSLMMSIKARRSMLSAIARRISGSLKGGLSRLISRLRLMPPAMSLADRAS